MYTTLFSPFLKRHLALCSYLKTFPYDFNPETRRLFKVTDGECGMRHRLMCLIILAYMSTLLLGLIMGNHSAAARIIGIVFFMTYCLPVGQWNYNLEMTPVQVLNAFMDFETKVLKDRENMKMSLLARAMALFMHVAHFSVIAVPMAAFALILVRPCTPPFLLSLSNQCEGIVWYGPAIIIPLFELWIGLQFFITGTVWSFFGIFVSVVTLQTYFRILNSQILASVSLDDVNQVIQKYRGIQVLEKHLNEWLKPVLVPSLITLAPSLQILSQYVCIQMHNDIPMPGFLVVPLIVQNTIIVNILVFTLASYVFSSSARVMQNIKRRIRKEPRRSTIKKDLKACSIMKIKFGTNFVDRGTPLVIQDFCLSQTMQLLLIKRGTR
ncbi:hypothetical protein Fcan01_17514 [Folsomia candida]|uniref:Odorant receptor n=1 Tax=Folsomia candida TaxID=158441 RepID=A0A226DU25_FOLCA|nr:hypothetical protein Fcan01_17514 [Folsomia candida]